MEIEKAFKRLLVKNPFYGLFCLSLPKEITTRVSTLCVAKDGINCKLCINPEFWEQHTDDEQIALLTHELSHICLQHIFMSDSFSDGKIFNMAADMEVNSYIDNLPKDACRAAEIGNQIGIPLTDGMGTKKYYEALTQYQDNKQQQAQSPQKPCNGGQGGQSGQDTSSSSSSEATQEESSTNPKGQQESEEEKKYPDSFNETYNHVDDHSTWKEFSNIPEANKQLMVNNVCSIIKQTAEQIEKTHGVIPGELEEIIEKLREKKPEVFNWKAYFRRLLGSIYDVNIKSTRRKESKRFAGSTGIQHKKKVSILVAIDTSGSVSKKELQEFFSEIDYVYKAGARVTIIECDSSINSITEYKGVIPKIHGRGGKMKICASLCSNA